MKRYRVFHPITHQGGEVTAENGPQACAVLGLNYRECLWIRIRSTAKWKPPKHYVRRLDNG